QKGAEQYWLQAGSHDPHNVFRLYRNRKEHSLLSTFIPEKKKEEEEQKEEKEEEEKQKEGEEEEEEEEKEEETQGPEFDLQNTC
ncbi:hypothetical protein STEG23_029288, partial [Scotinomys teguina]